MNKQYRYGFKHGLESRREWSHTDVALLSSELQKRGKSARDTADYIHGLCDGVNTRNETRIQEASSTR